MLRLGIIGTNWITQQFVEAGKANNTFKLTEVYSRMEEHAKAFVDKLKGNDITLTTDIDAFFDSDNFDVVYIASPNSLHFQYIKQAIKAGKQLVVEKPLVSTRAEFEEVTKLLKQNPQVYLFEAARHIHEKEFKALQNQVNQAKEIDGATIVYRKYSSRYDAVLAGQEPNVFSPKFSGGALYDLGVYLLYDAISLFGMPKDAEYIPQMLKTGVDGQGTIVLHYQTYDVTMLVGKISNSYLPSEIYTGKKTIMFNDGGTVRKIWDNQDDYTLEGPDRNPMLAETKVFADTINKQDRAEFEKLFRLADQVNQVLTTIRKKAGIKFAADNK